MGMVAPQQRIASAFAVLHGRYGDVTREAQERGVCRQWVYREAAWVMTMLQGVSWQRERTALQEQIGQLQENQADFQERLSQAVVVDEDKQKEFACLGQALGVSLNCIRTLLEVLLGDRTPSVPKLGRWTKKAGEKAGVLLEVFDACTHPQVRQVVADEIYVKDPVLMMVEPQSLCWLSGRLSPQVSGEEWAKEFGQLPALEQVTRDAGMGMEKGVTEVNQERSTQSLTPITEQLDHFHTFMAAGPELRKVEGRVRQALAKADEAERQREQQRKHGQPMGSVNNRCSLRWRQAEKAMAEWEQCTQTWEEIKTALEPWTPEGELNTRQRAEAILSEKVPQLPEGNFGKARRLLQRPETLTYLDNLHHQLEKLPVPAEVRQAAVRQEGLRRRPHLLQGTSSQAAARRGVLLVAAVVLAKAGVAGEAAVQGVKTILRNSWRASSLVECINSVLRMQQARHRKISQSLLDLKRLYWNCHTFRQGRRRGTCPYQRLGLPWPEGRRWWDVLKWSPEQLRDKLSTAKMAA